MNRSAHIPVQPRKPVLSVERPAPRSLNLVEDDEADTILDPRSPRWLEEVDDDESEDGDVPSVGAASEEWWQEDETVRPDNRHLTKSMRVQMALMSSSGPRSPSSPVRTAPPMPGVKGSPTVKPRAAVAPPACPKAVEALVPPPAEAAVPAAPAPSQSKWALPSFLTRPEALTLRIGLGVGLVVVMLGLGVGFQMSARREAPRLPLHGVRQPVQQPAAKTDAVVLPRATLSQPQAYLDAQLKGAIRAFSRKDYAVARESLNSYTQELPNEPTRTAVKILDSILKGRP